jgi:lysophospholipase L1-like esterase
VLFVLLVAGSAEILLQLASLSVRDRGGGAPGAAFRILCIGDSHTYGAGLPEDQSYPAHLQRQLDERSPGGFSVINLGVPGLNTSQMRARLPLQVARYQPDLVIAWAGVNNAWNVAGRDLADAGWLDVIESAAMRSRLYRLVRAQIHDRAIARTTRLASLDGVRQSAVRERCRGEGCGDLSATWSVGTDGAVDVVQHRKDQAGRDNALHEETVYLDYLAIHEWLERAEIPLLVIRYPSPFWPGSIANRAIQRLEAYRAIDALESKDSIARLRGKDRNYRWALHPNGAMYAEVARDLVARVEAKVASHAKPARRNPDLTNP